METNLMTSGKNNIIYVKNGLGHKIGNNIYLHEDLKQYPKLHDYVVKHEIGHTSGSYGIPDILNEFKINIPNVIKLAYFSLTRPSTWSDALPISYNKQEGWTIDYSLTILSMILIGIILFFII